MGALCPFPLVSPPSCVPSHTEQSGCTPSTPGHSLGDLLRDAPVLEPDLGFLHRLHGETLDICGSEGTTGTHRGGRGLQERRTPGPGGGQPQGCMGRHCRTHMGGNSTGNKPPSQPHSHAWRIHWPGEPVMSWPGGDVLFSFSALGKGLSSRISKSSRRSYSLPR